MKLSIKSWIAQVFVGMLSLLLVGCSNTVNAESDITQADRTLIASEVKKELTRLISEEGVLDAAIERGIERFVIKQQQAQQARKQAERSSKAINVRPVSKSRDHISGDGDAVISLVEYSDFECPFCKRFHPKVKKLLEKNKGKVNWVYRHFPLEFHNPGAQKQAEASECADELGGNELFWRYADLIYERTRSNGKGFPIKDLVPLAKELGLDEVAFRTCLDSGRMAQKVKEDYENGARSGITGTPGSIFINHKTGKVHAVSGDVPIKQLQLIVNQLLSP